MKAITVHAYLWPALWLSLVGSFAVNGLICYKCDSLRLGACATSLDETNLPYEECDKHSLQCVMSIVDTTTYRGCSSNTPTIGATYKKLCSDNLCNKGVFPPGRLKCYQCHGAECVTKREGKAHPCLYHNEDDECFTEVVSVAEVNRGCRSDTNHTVKTDVVYCNINACNNEAGVKRLRCAKCDSKTGRGCKMDLFEINNKICNITLYDTCEVDSLLTRKKKCFFYHHLDRVIRGCSENITPQMRLHENDLEECENSDYCNTGCLARQKCLSCNSLANPMCRSNASELALGVCSSPEVSSCFTCETDDFNVWRGCGPAPIQRSGFDRCYECADSSGCNAATLARCYKCSSVENTNCATWDYPGSLDIEECTEPRAACLTVTFTSGITMRGCESSSFNCNTWSNSTTNCSSCEGNFCNKG